MKDMDKITRIKRLVKSSLNSSFGGEISISDMIVLPTQKYDEGTKEWIPDSYSLFLQIQRGSVTLDLPREVESFLESLLGFECCVDFV
jgi:hypothetical protein